MFFRALSLGLIQSWLWLFFMNGPLIFAVMEKMGLDTEKEFLVFLFFNSLSFLLTALLAPKLDRLASHKGLIMLASALMSGGTLLAGLYPAASQPGFTIITSAALAAGLGSGMLVTAIGECFSIYSVKKTSLLYGTAVTAGTASFFLLSRLAFQPALIITAAMPLVSAIFLLYTYDTSEKFYKPKAENQGFPLPLKLVLLILFVDIPGGVMYKFVSMGAALSAQESYWVTNIVYWAAAILACGAIFSKPGMDLRWIYRPVLPLFSVGFLLFPFLGANMKIISFTFLQSGMAFFDTYTWLLFVYFAAQHRYPAKIVGWGMFILTFSVLTGQFVFTGLLSLIPINQSMINTVALTAAILMVIGTSLFQDKKETFAGFSFPNQASGPFLLPGKPFTPRLSHLETAASAEDIDAASDTKTAETIAEELTEEKAVTKEVTTKEVVSEKVVTEVGIQEGPAEGFRPDSIISVNSTRVPFYPPDNPEVPMELFAQQYQMTDREYEVLSLLLQGRNNPFIREQLNISGNTLKTHLRNIYRKVDVGNRQELLSAFDVFKDFGRQVN